MNFIWHSFFSFVFLLWMVNAEDIQLHQDKIKPRSYSISITPDFENATFQGSVLIDLEVSDYIENITLHAHNITVDDVLISKVDGDFALECKAIMDHGNQRMNISCADWFYDGDYKVLIDYRGKLQDDMTGFYRSYYFVDGAKKWLGATQFEATSARKAFPCFDEPRFRTKFNLTFSLPKGYSVISNTKLTKETVTDKANEFNFATYPKMPTYLLGWIIYDHNSFLGSEATTQDDIEFRVWSQKKFSNQLKFANTMGPKFLSSLANFTGLPYKNKGKLEKMDQIAVPDFDAGAMENWGLVTYRESRLLCDEKLTNTEAKRDIMMVIAHEFTHQWFGNLVTLQWWSYTWLNEAFARFFQYFIPAKEFPEWKLDEQFVVNALQVALDFDSKPTHPMTNAITHHDNISAMFDTITYSKGASIVRMMEHTLTPATFQKGLRKYLRIKGITTNQVATPDDLFLLVTSVLTEEEKKKFDFKTVFKSWTETSGFPLITVTRDNKTGSAMVKQERFFYDKHEDNETAWHVPLTYTVQSEGNFNDTTIKAWLTPEKKNITIEKLGTNGWVVFNIQQKGFYRVNYDEGNWKKIIEQLKTNHSKIGVINRAQLIDDAFSLARAGKLNYTIVLDLSTYLEKERDYVPWIAAARGFNYIMSHFNQSPDNDKLSKYVLKLVSPAVKEVSFKEVDKESVVTKLMRILVLSVSARVEHEESVKNAVKIAHDLATKSRTEFSADIQRALLCKGVESSNATVWKNLFDKISNLESPTQFIDFIKALTCTKQPEAIDRYINETISDPSVIRAQDDVTVYAGLSSSHVGATTMVKFVFNNYKRLISSKNSEDKIIGDLVKHASGQIYNPDDLAEIKKFVQNMTKTLSEGTLRSLNSSIHRIEGNFEWRSKNWKDIVSWLRVEELITTTSQAPGTTPGISTSKPATTPGAPGTSSTKKPGSSANSITSGSISFIAAGILIFLSMTYNKLSLS